MALWGFGSGDDASESTKEGTDAKVDATGGGETPQSEGDMTLKSDSPAAAGANSFDGRVQQRFGKVRSALGPGTVIQGKLTFDTAVRIDGQLAGEVYAASALIIGPGGQVDARITVGTLWVQGKVKGSVSASEGIEVFPGAELDGDVVTTRIHIHEGALFNGSCSMQNQKRKELKI